MPTYHTISFMIFPPAMQGYLNPDFFVVIIAPQHGSPRATEEEPGKLTFASIVTSPQKRAY
jgi:hypothetical protein